MTWFINPETKELPCLAYEFLLDLDSKYLLMYSDINYEGHSLSLEIINKVDVKFDKATEKELNDFLKINEVENLKYKIIETILRGSYEN